VLKISAKQLFTTNWKDTEDAVLSLILPPLYLAGWAASTASAAERMREDHDEVMSVDICGVAVGGQLDGRQSSLQRPPRPPRSIPQSTRLRRRSQRPPRRFSLPTGTRGLIMLETFSMTDFPARRCVENYRLSLMSLERRPFGLPRCDHKLYLATRRCNELTDTISGDYHLCDRRLQLHTRLKLNQQTLLSRRRMKNFTPWLLQFYVPPFANNCLFRVADTAAHHAWSDCVYTAPFTD